MKPVRWRSRRSARARRGNDVLNGNQGDDLLLAGAGNDKLNGGVGTDPLIGEGGNDTLLGGAGADRFVILAVGGADVISRLDKFDTIQLAALAGFDDEWLESWETRTSQNAS
jgi:Ca2+-binding RTX toxin-like protein